MMDLKQGEYMSKTYIKEINIRKFRALTDLNIEFSPKLNIICGQNGTSKSTILGILAQICSFENEYINGSKTPLNYRTIGDKEFKSSFSDHFRFSKKFDKPRSKTETNDYWDIGIKVHDGYSNKPLDNLRLDFTRRGQGLRLVLRGNSDRNITHPVIFLGLRRLFPISERQKYTRVEFNYLTNQENKTRFIQTNSKILLKDHMNFYQGLSSTNAKVPGSSAMPSSVVHGQNYDQDSVSIGEDNVGQIVQALESFRMLKEQYPNYRGGLLLIDEVDASLFPAAQKRLIDILKEYSEEYDIQVVMTSHSPTIIKYLEELGNNSGKIIPLYYEQGNIKTGNKRFKDIEADLLAQLPINSSIKIRCYLEDGEATELFKAILNENNIGKRILNKKIEIMDVSMGSQNYIHLIDKGVPEFKDLSLVILDGDEPSNNSTIIKLPFCVPPDQLLFEFLFLLNNDDPFWAEINTSKQVFFNDFGKPVIQYFELNSQMNLLSLRKKIQLKKGPERDRDLEEKAREIFKKFYKHSFIQGLLESENTNPFNELIKKKFDINAEKLATFIAHINRNIDHRVKTFYQS